jgi:cytochrome P450
VRIPENAIVLLASAAANRDPEVFDDPDDFNIFRPELDMGIPPQQGGTRLTSTGSVNTHTAFGAGQHFCPGNQLARLQAVLGSQMLDSELGEMKLEGPLPAMAYSGNLRSVRALPLSFNSMAGR